MRKIPLLTMAAVALLLCATRPSGSETLAGQICVFLESGRSIEEVNARWGTRTLVAVPQEDLYLLSAPGAANAESLAAVMANDPAVASADANYILATPEAVRMMVVAAVGGTWGDYADQALTERIGLDAGHMVSRGAGATVAVLDTGVDQAHPALAGKLSPNGYDFVSDDPEPWEEANALDDDGDGLADGGYGHGTMVAGIVALVAPEATILPLRVLDDEGRGDLFAIARAILYANAMGADVINMSFGTAENTQTLQRLVTEADGLGTVVVAAAGNEDRESPPYYPAYHPRSLMVTALDSMDAKANFSDFNQKVLVSAPGVGVRSAYPGGDWGIGSGCSFAAPFVAGEAALIRSQTPGATRQEIAARLAAGVEPIYQIEANLPYLNELGTGRVYVPAALAGPTAVAVAPPQAPSYVRAFPNPSLGTVRFDLRLGAQNPSGARLEIIDVSGRRIRVLAVVNGNSLTWDGLDAKGRAAPAGAYYARLVSKQGIWTASVRLVR